MKKIEEPCLWEVFLQFLSSLGHDSPQLEKGGRLIETSDSSEDIQDLLEKIYRNHPDSALVCEMLTDLDVVCRNGVTAMFRWFTGRLGQNPERVVPAELIISREP